MARGGPAPSSGGHAKDGPLRRSLGLAAACVLTGALVLLAQAPWQALLAQGGSREEVGGGGAASRRLQEPPGVWPEAPLAVEGLPHSEEPHAVEEAPGVAEPRRLQGPHGAETQSHQAENFGNLEAPPPPGFDAHGQPLNGEEAEHGEEAAHGEEHGGEHEGHHNAPGEAGLSFTLICIVMIALALFFFVNSEDADIVAYTWDLLGKGTNVFVSVMIFLMAVEVCRRIWPQRSWVCCTLVMGVVLIAMTFSNLQISRQYTKVPAIGPKKQRYQGAVDYSKITKKDVFGMTFGGIQAHLAAFTMINLWAHVQDKIHTQGWLFGGGPWSVAAVVPLAAAVHLLVMASMGALRKHFATMDGLIDEDETRWLHESQEVDVEAGGLELSFLAVQAIRYELAGTMPNPTGGFHGRVPEMRENWWLVGIAFCTGLCSLIVRRQLASARARAEGRRVGEALEESSEEEFMDSHRLSPGLAVLFSTAALLVDFFSFLCGWSLFFFFEGLMKTWDARGVDGGHSHDVMLIRTSVALMCSGVVFVVICCMDKIVDIMVSASMSVAKEAQVLISVVGMMMGFAWERCFHHAFEVSAGGVVEALHQKLGMKIVFSELGVFLLTCTTMAVATILVMFWYINPRAMESRAKAKFDKAYPDGIVPDAQEKAMENGWYERQSESKIREHYYEGGFFSSLCGILSRPPPATRSLLVEPADEAPPIFSEPTRRQKEQYQTVIERPPEKRREEFKTVEYVTEAEEEDEVESEEEVEEVRQRLEEAPLPFPVERRQPDYASFPYHGQAPWAQNRPQAMPWGTVGPFGSPTGGQMWGVAPPAGVFQTMPPGGMWPPPGPPPGPYGPPMQGYGPIPWGD